MKIRRNDEILHISHIVYNLYLSIFNSENSNSNTIRFAFSFEWKP